MVGEALCGGRQREREKYSKYVGTNDVREY